MRVYWGNDSLASSRSVTSNLEFSRRQNLGNETAGPQPCDLENLPALSAEGPQGWGRALSWDDATSQKLTEASAIRQQVIRQPEAAALTTCFPLKTSRT